MLQKTNVENVSGPPEAFIQNHQRQKVKGRKASAGHREQKMKQHRLQRRDASYRPERGRKQEAQPSGDLLQTLQKRHREEVEKAEIIRQQMK